MVEATLQYETEGTYDLRLKQVVQELGIEATVEKVEDINVITGFGVMMTPALAIDGEVKTVGRVSSPEEIKELLS